MISLRFFFSALIFSVAVAQAQQLMHYTSAEYKYSIQVPEDWQRKDDVRSKSVAMVLVGPENATMSIVFHPSSKSVKTSQFVNQYPRTTYGNQPEYSLEEKGVFASRDDEADYLVVEYKEGEVLQRAKICFYDRKNEYCVVTLSMNKEAFHKELPRIDAILKSFTFETDQEKVDDN